MGKTRKKNESDTQPELFMTIENTLTKGMEYDVCSIPDNVNILDAFPHLKELPSFEIYPNEDEEDPLDASKVIRYILVLYSKDSFVNSRPTKPLDDRKRIAANVSGFEKDKTNEFSDSVHRNLFQLNHHIIPAMIVDYLRMQHHYLWEEICLGEQLLWEIGLNIFNRATDDKDKDNVATIQKKRALYAEQKGVRKSIEASYKELFAENYDLKEIVKTEVRKTLAQKIKDKNV